MVPTITMIEIHPTVTRRTGRQYQFTPKHHGCDPGDGCDPGAACWLPALTRDDEFAVFDGADFSGSEDAAGNLYGVSRDGAGGGLRYIGTWYQQVAVFPVARAGEAWHGYPLWPLGDAGPDNRRGEKMRPDKRAFQKMEQSGLITRRERKRLMKGDEA